MITGRENKSSIFPGTGYDPDTVYKNEILGSLIWGDSEFIRRGGLSGLFEVGVAVDRDLRYLSGRPENYYLPEAFFLRAGLAF